MSLIRIAARIAAVEALRGKTLVGDNVLDSQIGAIDVNSDGSIGVGEEARFITVYTDAGVAGGFELNSRALAPNGSTEIIFEAGITATMSALNDQGEREVLVGVPDTDDAFEFYLDLVMRQISDVLTDPNNAWSEILRALVSRIEKKEITRVSSGQGGVRLAAQQLKLTAELWPDPIIGELKPTHPLARFFAMAETLSGEVAAKIGLMKSCLTGNELDWQQAMRRYGMTRGEADALIITPSESGA